MKFLVTEDEWQVVRVVPCDDRHPHGQEFPAAKAAAIMRLGEYVAEIIADIVVVSMLDQDRAMFARRPSQDLRGAKSHER